MSVGPRLALLDAPRPPLPPLEFQDGGGVTPNVLYSMSWMRFGLARAVLSSAAFVFFRYHITGETRAAGNAYTGRRKEVGFRCLRRPGESKAKQDRSLAVVPTCRAHGVEPSSSRRTQRKSPYQNTGILPRVVTTAHGEQQAQVITAQAYPQHRNTDFPLLRRQHSIPRTDGSSADRSDRSSRP